MTVYDRLYEDILAELGEMPLIDVHTHLRWDSARPSTLADVLLYHFFEHELRACGMPDTCALTPRERVQAALPYLGRARNTGTRWALRAIFRDLYGVQEDFLCEGNWEEVFQRFDANQQDPDWPRHVLAERAHIRSCSINHRHYRQWKQEIDCGPRDGRPGMDLFFPTLEESVFVSGTVRDIVDSLQAHSSVTVADAATLEQALGTFLSPEVLSTIHAYLAWLPASLRYEPADAKRVDAALRRALKGAPVTDADRNAVHVYCLRVLLESLKGRAIVLQLFLGSERSAAGRKPCLAGHSTETLQSLMDLFLEHPDQRFELQIGASASSQQANALAKMLPNVGLSGIWWHNMYPCLIRRIIEERLDCVPLWKVCGFFSDAYNVEWSYAKWQLVRRELAALFADRIANGRMTREDAREIAWHWLWENPSRVYRIEEAVGDES